MKTSFSVDTRPSKLEAPEAPATLPTPPAPQPPPPPPAAVATPFGPVALPTPAAPATPLWMSRAGAGGGWAADARFTRAPAAMRTFSTIWVASSFKPLATPMRGLATKSTAPSSSAFIVTSPPRSVNVEIITTGVGRRRIRRPRKSMPSIRGISTSSVITSGSRSRIISRATIGSFAVPTHSMSGCRLMISASRLRTRAESSTTTTRINLFVMFTQPVAPDAAPFRRGRPNRPRRFARFAPHCRGAPASAATQDAHGRGA